MLARHNVGPSNTELRACDCTSWQSSLLGSLATSGHHWWRLHMRFAPSDSRSFTHRRKNALPCCSPVGIAAPPLRRALEKLLSREWYSGVGIYLYIPRLTICTAQLSKSPISLLYILDFHYSPTVLNVYRSVFWTTCFSPPRACSTNFS